MTIHNLSALFQPSAIALVGVTGRAGCLGTVMARNLFHGGFRGPVMPVSKDLVAVEGVLAYRTIADLPLTPDLAVICTPLAEVPAALSQLAARGARAALITAETEGNGGNAQALRQQIQEIARRAGMRVLGPGSLGVMVPGRGLNASFIQTRPAKGDIALVGQCGTVVTAVVEWARERGIGFSHAVAVGDSVDVDIADVIDYLASDGGVRAILLHFEAVGSARKMMSASRAAARHKPVIVIKAGSNIEATCRASARIGAPPGSDEVYATAFRRAGILRVRHLADLFDAAQTLGMGVSIPAVPASPGRLAILTNGNGIAVLATDSLIEGGGRLASLSPDTIVALDKALPKSWSHGNPVNIGSDATPERYAQALAMLLQDQTNDGVLVLNYPAAGNDRIGTARAVVEVAAQQAYGRRRGVLTCWLGEGESGEARRLFAARRIPTYDTPDGAVRGFLQLVEFHRNQELLMETPPSVPDQFEVDEAAARRVIEQAMDDGREWLSTCEALRLLAAYGLTAEEAHPVSTADEAAITARTLGRPVVLKLRPADPSLALESGGVVRYLKGYEQVRAAAEYLFSVARDAGIPAGSEGLVVQPMADLGDVQQLVVGMSEDRLFGPVLRFGQGGAAGALLADEALTLPPLNMNLARDLMARTRVWRLMHGLRGQRAVAVDAVAQALIKVSQLVVDCPEIAELEINPLYATPRGVLVLDARIRVAVPEQAGTARLAIQPYPKQLEENVILRDGTPALIRPIRPEDEPALHAMIAAMTPEDLRLRFFAPTQRLSHHTAARMTQIDYDREMAFVLVTAEDKGAEGKGSEGKGGEILGINHLLADPDLERGEFAPMVRSGQGGHGLGLLLMRKVVSYAAERGIREVYAEVLRENLAMIRLAQKVGFTRHDDPDDQGVLEVRLRLGG